MLLLITYDLNKQGQDYDALYKEIKTAPDWIHPMDSLWMIYTSKNPQFWNDKLSQVIDKNDRLFIVDITGQSRQGWLDKSHWEWIKEHNK